VHSIAVEKTVSPGVGNLTWTVNVEEIERARILQGWTRRDLARQAHIDEGTLGDLLSGRRRPTFGVLRAVGLVLGLSPEGLIEFARRDLRTGVAVDIISE